MTFPGQCENERWKCLCIGLALSLLGTFSPPCEQVQAKILQDERKIGERIQLSRDQSLSEILPINAKISQLWPDQKHHPGELQNQGQIYDYGFFPLIAAGFPPQKKWYLTNVTTIQLLLFFFCLFSAAPLAYGGSQTKGQIRAVAAGLCHNHSNVGSERCLQPTSQLTAIPDP